MRSGQQLTRLLRLVPYLSSRPGVEVTAVASAFGVSPSQIIRDLEVLQFCGLPGGYIDDLFDVDIEAVKDDGRIDFRNAEVLNRPLRLRPAEAASLLAALRLVVDLGGPTDAAASALAKLEAAVGQEDDRVSVSVAPSDPDARALLAAAIDAATPVKLTYRKPGVAGESSAEVEPARLNLIDGYTYLDAWSRPREAWRSYRLDRITGIELLDGTFDSRELPNAAWFDDVPDHLSLTVTPGGAWISEYYPTKEVSRTDELTTVTFPVASRQWAIGLLLRLGNSVVSVSDADVQAEARQRARDALAHYPAQVG